MLDRAYKYNDRINSLLRDLYDTDYAKYYFLSQSYYEGFSDNVERESEWNRIARVSILNKELLGYMTACISRDSRVVTNLSLINFKKETNIFFTKDVFSFFNYLFNVEKVESITWYVCTENKKAVKIYDNFISKFADIKIAKSTPIRNMYYTNRLGYLNGFVYTLLIDEYKKYKDLKK